MIDFAGGERFIVTVGADQTEFSRVMRALPQQMESAVAQITRIADRLELMPVARMRAQGTAGGRALGSAFSEEVTRSTRNAAERIRAGDGRFVAAGAAAGGKAGASFSAAFVRQASGIGSALDGGALAKYFAVGAAVAGARELVQATTDVARAQSQLTGTARISGLALDTLQSRARDTQGTFKLSAGLAAGYTTELTRLASKAGDASKAGAGITAFLNLGAARGYNATQTLQAVSQAVLGIDEGTDKLFGKNPSVLYAEYAARIGTTAGKLSDQQKAQALLDAALRDGERVRGAYTDFLTTTPGKLEQTRIKTEQLTQKIASALSPAFDAAADAASGLIDFVGENGPLVTGLATTVTATYALSKAVGVLNATAAGGGLARIIALASSPGALAVIAAAGAVGTVVFAAGKESERRDAPRLAADQAAQAARVEDVVRNLAATRAKQQQLIAAINAADPANAANPGDREGINARRSALTRELQFVDQLVAAYEKRNAAAKPMTPPVVAPPAVVDGAKGARKAFADLENQVQGVQRLMGLVKDEGASIPGLDERALSLYDRVTEALGRQGDQFGENASKLREYQSALLDVQTVALARTPEAVAAGLISRAALSRQTPFTLDYAPQVTARATGPDVSALVLARPLSAFSRATTAVSNRLDFLRDAADEAASALYDAPAALRDFVTGVGRLAGAGGAIAGAIRRPGDLIARTESGRIDALGSVGNISSVIGAVGTVVSGLTSIGRSLFGRSEYENRRDGLLRDNTERLAELRSGLANFSTGPQGITATLTALSTRAGAQLLNLRALSPLIGGGDINRTRVGGVAFKDYFRETTGVSIAQIERLAEGEGIRLFDEKGRLLAGSVEQLREALAIAGKELTRFGNTLDDQRSRESLRSALFTPGAAGTPGATVGLELGLLQRLAPNLGSAFTGLTADSATGREAIRAGLRDLFTRIDTNRLQLSDLGQLSSLDDLTGIIRTVNDALSQMGETAGGVTASLLNVPTGFKIAYARYLAQDAVVPSPATSLPPLANPYTPGPIPAPTGFPDGAGNPLYGNGGVQFTGDIYVTPGAGETAEQAFDFMIAKKKRLAAARGMNPTRWAEVS